MPKTISTCDWHPKAGQNSQQVFTKMLNINQAILYLRHQSKKSSKSFKVVNLKPDTNTNLWTKRNICFTSSALIKATLQLRGTFSHIDSL